MKSITGSKITIVRIIIFAFVMDAFFSIGGYKGAVEVSEVYCNGFLAKVVDSHPRRHREKGLGDGVGIIINTITGDTCGASILQKEFPDYGRIRQALFGIKPSSKITVHCFSSNYYPGCSMIRSILDENSKELLSFNSNLVRKKILNRSEAAKAQYYRKNLIAAVLVFLEIMRTLVMSLIKRRY